MAVMQVGDTIHKYKIINKLSPEKNTFGVEDLKGQLFILRSSAQNESIDIKSKYVVKKIAQLKSGEILTEYCEGGGLKNLIEKRKLETEGFDGPLFSEKEIFKMIWDVMSGLKAVQTKYGNISSSNILICKDGTFKLDCFAKKSSMKNDNPAVLGSEDIAENKFCEDVFSTGLVALEMMNVSYSDSISDKVSTDLFKVVKCLLDKTNSPNPGEVLKHDIVFDAHEREHEEQLKAVMKTVNEDREAMMRNWESMMKTVNEDREAMMRNWEAMMKAERQEKEAMKKVVMEMKKEIEELRNITSQANIGLTYLQTSQHSSQPSPRHAPSPLSPTGTVTSSSVSSLHSRFEKGKFRPQHYRRAALSFDQSRHQGTGPFRISQSHSSSSSSSTSSTSSSTTSSSSSSACSSSSSSAVFSPTPLSPAHILSPHLRVSSMVDLRRSGVFDFKDVAKSNKF